MKKLLIIILLAAATLPNALIPTQAVALDTDES